jgi:hypothetical protein
MIKLTKYDRVNFDPEDAGSISSESTNLQNA